MSDSEQVVLYAGWAAFGVADFSPACLKLKTYLRMAGIPYEAKRGDPRQGPTKKVPYITHAGHRIGDSGLVIEYLKQAFGDRLDRSLSEQQHALGHALRRTAEESLYWTTLYLRWSDDAVWQKLAVQFRPMLPPVIAPLIMKALRKNALRSAWGQGIARHERENIINHGCADVDAIAELFGQNAYLFGDSPTSYDASIFGFVANALALPAEGRVARRVRQHSNLVTFVERVREAYWSTPEIVT